MTATRRILFVDDDPQLLSGFGKALRKHRHRWTMVFADSGEAALAEVRRGGFDVVVSDMRMPVMDGAELLAHIRDADPTTIRMILSGFSDRSAIVRALPVAHQFFNKPCDLGELSRAIDRACELRAMFTSDALRTVIDKLGPLPPVPPAYHELTALAGCAELGPEAIAEVVERDAGLREHVLQGASSPRGFDRPARSVADAVSRIGIEMLSGLALASHALAIASDRGLAEPSIAEIQHHSLAMARAARDLVEPCDVAGEAFIAGLVHDVGKLIIALALPGEHAAIEQQLRAGGRYGAVERAVLGTSHGAIGAYVLCQWGLPLPIVDAIAHHDDDACVATPVLAALRAAHLAIT